MHRYQELFIGLKGRSSPHGDGIESCPALNRSGEIGESRIRELCGSFVCIVVICNYYMGIYGVHNIYSMYR